MKLEDMKMAQELSTNRDEAALLLEMLEHPDAGVIIRGATTLDARSVPLRLWPAIHAAVASVIGKDISSIDAELRKLGVDA